MPSFHEVASIFPYMGDAELSQLADDIKANGLREPIWTYQGQIIDGRNRFNACAKAGVEPQYREWDGNGSLVQFVVSLNMHRRHLNESQRGLLAGEIAVQLEKEARQRQVAGLRKGSEISKNAEKSPLVSNDTNGRTRATAAKAANTSEGTAARGTKVAKKATDKVKDAVRQGHVSLSAASTVADLPPEEQDAVVEKVIRGEAKNIGKAIEEIQETVADVLASLPSKSEIDAKQKADKAAAQEILRDSNGSPLTAAAVKAFDQIPLFNELEQHIRNAGKTLEKIMGTPARARVKEYFAPSEKLKNVQLARALRDLIEDGKPYAVCPTCQGDKSCETCGGGAFITKHQYKQIKQFAEADGLVRR